MQSNYKRIGNYVEQVKVRNKDNSLTVEQLRGIRINKEFMSSVANVNGTNLSKYKVVEKNQFAYNPMHVGRDEVLPISMLVDNDRIIVSPAYVIFEVVDANELLPEYLMIWCRRSEFDRNAWFTTDSSVRGGFSWDDFCDLELPVPSIEKQKEIVKEYHTITDRIKLNEQLNQNLEDTAQSIYKKWFVNFEFPDENGKPYKSNAGEMVYNEELDMEMPAIWSTDILDNIIVCNSDTYNKNDKFENIKYLDTSNITNNKIDELKLLDINLDVIPSRAKRKVKHNSIIYSTVRPNLCHYGILKNPPENLIVSTGFAVLDINKSNLFAEYVYMWLTSNERVNYFQSKAEMSVSTYPSIKPEDLLETTIMVPIDYILEKARLILQPLVNKQMKNHKMSKLMNDMKDMLLSKMASIEE